MRLIISSGESFFLYSTIIMLLSQNTSLFIPPLPIKYQNDTLLSIVYQNLIFKNKSISYFSSSNKISPKRSKIHQTYYKAEIISLTACIKISTLHPYLFSLIFVCNPSSLSTILRISHPALRLSHPAGNILKDS